MDQNSQLGEFAEFKGRCQLMGSFGLMVQCFLFLMIMSILVIKRYTDSIFRPWRIWFIDISKQGFSTSILHFINIGISIWFVELMPILASDQCQSYFIYLTTDATVGTFFCVIYLNLLNKRFKNTYPKLVSGNYYKMIKFKDENFEYIKVDIWRELKWRQDGQNFIFQINNKTWIYQSLIWLAIVLISKLQTTTINYFFYNYIIQITNFIFERQI